MNSEFDLTEVGRVGSYNTKNKIMKQFNEALKVAYGLDGLLPIVLQICACLVNLF